MEEFQYKSFLEQRKMAIEELKKYYRELRKYEYYKDEDIKGIEIRKKIYFLVRFILKIDKLTKLRTVKIINNQRIKNDKPRIYACTHIGRFDIESAIESVGESAWFIMGDPGETYRNLDGLVLRVNGVSWFDMGDDEELRFDAHTVNHRQLKILGQGGNELSFPEAAWNIDPIIPVGELNPGVVKRAIAKNADIIPVGIEQYRGKYLKHYYVNIGKNMDLTGADVADKYEIAEELRSRMAGLKWDIWEQYGHTSRSELPELWADGYDQFIESIMCDTENGYTIEEINLTKYHRKDLIIQEKPDEVFSYLSKINMRPETAFMARDICKYNEQKVLKKTP